MIREIRIAATVAVICAALGGFFLGGAIANKSDEAAQCPDGQALYGFTVDAGKGTLELDQPDGLPAGTSFETRGGGVVARSSSEAVSVHAEEPLRLKVDCRNG